MKTTIISFLILCTALFINSDSKAQSATKEEAVRKVFKAFQEKDVDAFVKLFPDAATTIRFVEKLLSNDSVDEMEKAGMREFLQGITDEKLREEYSDDFKHHILNGELKGVVWKNATMQSFTADSSYDKETRTHKIFGKIYFTSGVKEYFMRYDEVIWFDKEGWYGVSIEKVNEKDMEYETEEELELSDSTTIPVDTVKKSNTEIPESKKTPAKTPAGNKNSKQKQNTPIKKD